MLEARTSNNLVTKIQPISRTTKHPLYNHMKSICRPRGRNILQMFITTKYPRSHNVCFWAEINDGVFKRTLGKKRASRFYLLTLNCNHALLYWILIQNGIFVCHWNVHGIKPEDFFRYLEIGCWCSLTLTV